MSVDRYYIHLFFFGALCFTPTARRASIDRALIDPVGRLPDRSAWTNERMVRHGLFDAVYVWFRLELNKTALNRCGLAAPKPVKTSASETLTGEISKY